MDKKYLDKILKLCTEPQLSMFNRMYPNGPDSKQIKRAIEQVERTILDLNEKVESLKNVEEEFSLYKERTQEIERLADKQIKEFEETITELQKEFEMIKNPINIKNADVQIKLNKLYALEAGGVDNWEWYDEVMRNIND